MSEVEQNERGAEGDDARAWSPEYVKGLTAEELPELASQIRRRIVSAVSANGGHLASNLGVVELTIALLRIFSPPRDRILFDVSHQSYAYKMLTGRAERFSTLRQLDGLSGFQKRSESDCDAFGAGHAGTSISAALGFAAARDVCGEDGHVVAVVGDASISNGVSLEALNNAVGLTKRLIVVLNDNEMSISQNVGAMASLFARMLTAPGVTRTKIAVERFGIQRLHLRWLRQRYRHLKTTIKRMFLRKNVFFEDLGFQYIGPVDGHDFKWLNNALQRALQSDRPALVHIATTKGKGYARAEKNPSAWHGVSPFNVESGVALKKSSVRSWSSAFGEALVTLAEKDSRVCAITAAMCDGTGLDGFAKAFPERFYDVGIAEEHQATFAAGLAAAGMRPVVAVYSTFFQRAIDGLIHDVALQKLPVIFCLDRAGVVANDGPTHHGIFDVALCRSIPGVTLMQPSDEAELARMLALALTLEGPVVVRYPRGAACGVEIPEEVLPLELGKARVVEAPAEGVRGFVSLWALGNFVPLAREVAEELRAQGIAVAVVDARFVKPVDTALLAEQVRDGCGLFLTLEDGIRTGGLGTAIAEALEDIAPAVRVIRCGWPEEQFVPHAASNAQLLERFGLTAKALAQQVLAHMPRG